MKRSPQVVDSLQFGSKLQYERETQGIRQAELAQAIGVAPNSVSYYENGKSLPSLDLAVQMADFFHVSMDYLLSRTEYNNYSNVTVKSVAETLIKLSQLQGVKVIADPTKNTASIEFQGSELADFLCEYARLLSFLSSNPSNSKGSNLKENLYINSLLNSLNDTPINELRMDGDELLSLYSNP